MNLFDKKGALMYILKVASAKNISQAKLIDGIYDYSHFNRMCNGKEPIKLEVLVFCAKKLSIDLRRISMADVKTWLFKVERILFLS